MSITSVVNQITQRIIRGNTPDTSDVLLYAPTEIVRVGLKADIDEYRITLDYTITGSNINWTPTGAEPSPGQVYYITYKYNPTQFLKDFDTITKEMEIDFNTLLPNLDVTKSVARDLFINVMGRQYTDEYTSARHIFLIQSLQNVVELTTEELDAIGVTYGKPRKPSTKSSGTAKFFMNIARAYPVTIPTGTRIGTQPSLTNNQQITFLTTEDKTILAGSLYVMVPIEAESSGSSGQVGAETIRIMIDTLDVDGVINSVATSGGEDQESNSDYASRLMNVFKARNIGSVNGIKYFVESQPNVIDVYIADVGNPVMVRDGGLGGKVDVYIQSESGFSGEITDESYAYTGSDYVFLRQPVLGIITVKVNDVPISSSNFQLISDTGIYKKSTRALDKLHISAGAVPTDNIKVTYTYNKLFNDIQTSLNSDANHIGGIDVLTRSAEETYIDVTGSIKIKTGYIFGDVKINVINQITNYIEAKEIGSKIVYGNIINIIHDSDGVEDIAPLSKLSRQNENTNTTIQLFGNEYPRAGIITINLML